MFRDEDSEHSSSSSLGRDSDLSGDEEGLEVQSQRVKGPLDTMDALEEVLPVDRGLSKFYNGKSKSFTSLVDAISASSVKEFAKPENLYARKRRNLLACSNFMGRKSTHRLRDNGTATSKRTANSSGSASVSGSTMSLSRRNDNCVGSHSVLVSSSNCRLPPHPQAKRLPSNGSCLPPPQQNFQCRSFSLSALERVATAASAD